MSNGAKLDWEGARRRLEESRAALEETFAPDPRRIEAAYSERARRLARPIDPGRHEPAVSVLVFRAAGGRYGIELPRVSEIVAGALCAHVPGAPAQLAGVIQVRGEIRPVWDLARILGVAGAAAQPGAVLLLPRASGEAGLRVDEVEGIQELRQADLGPPAEPRRHVKSVTPDFIAIIDPDELWKEDIG